MNRCDVGLYKNEFFNEKRMKEIEYASLLMILERLRFAENVLLKAKKTLSWQMELLLERFELIRARYEIDYLPETAQFCTSPNLFPPGMTQDYFKKKR